MAIYYSSACTVGKPAQTGFGDETVWFTFTFPAVAVDSDQVALAWIPINATVTDWYIDHTSFGAAAATIQLSDFSGPSVGAGAYLVNSTAVGPHRYTSYANGTAGSTGGGANGSIFHTYTSAATMTGYTNIPAEVADVFRLVVVAAPGTLLPTIVGYLRYVLT